MKEKNEPGEMAWRSNMIPFENCFRDETPGQRKVQRSQYEKAGSIPIIDQGQQPIAGFISDESLGYVGPLPVIVFGDHTRAFKFVEHPFALGADGIRVLSCNEPFIPKFLYFYFRSVRIPSRGYARHFAFLREILVPFRPKSEQRRIVELLEHADALVRKRTEADALAERILPVLFRHLFGDPATNSNGVKTDKLESLAFVRRGDFRHRPRTEPRFYGGPYPFIQINDITGSGILIRKYSQTLNEGGLAISRMFSAGTIVISIAATIAASGMLGFDSCFRIASWASAAETAEAPRNSCCFTFGFSRRN